MAIIPANPLFLNREVLTVGSICLLCPHRSSPAVRPLQLKTTPHLAVISNGILLRPYLPLLKSSTVSCSLYFPGCRSLGHVMM